MDLTKGLDVKHYEAALGLIVDDETIVVPSKVSTTSFSLSLANLLQCCIACAVIIEHSLLRQLHLT
jgi:hypothetical protein